VRAARTILTAYTGGRVAGRRKRELGIARANSRGRDFGRSTFDRGLRSRVGGRLAPQTGEGEGTRGSVCRWNQCRRKYIPDSILPPHACFSANVAEQPPQPPRRILAQQAGRMRDRDVKSFYRIAGRRKGKNPGGEGKAARVEMKRRSCWRKRASAYIFGIFAEETRRKSPAEGEFRGWRAKYRCFSRLRQ